MNPAFASPKIALRIAGASAVMLGLIGLLGAQAPILGQFRAIYGWVPTHCSVAFIVAGIGLASAGFSLPRLSQLSGLLVLVLAAELWAGDKGWVRFGLPEALLDQGVSPYAERVGAHTIVCFATLGIALLLLGSKTRMRSRGLVLAVVAGFVLALPVAELLGFAFGAAPAPEGFWSVALFTAPAHMLVGWALVVFAWHDTPQELRDRTYWPPLLLIVAVLSSTMLLWQALVSEDNAQIHAMVADRTDVVRSEIESGLSRRIQPLFAMIRRPGNAQARDEQTRFMGLVQADLTLNSIEAIDDHGRRLWRVASTADSGSSDDAGRTDLLRVARSREEPTMIRIASKGQKRFAIAVPRANRGFLVVNYSTEEFLSDALHWPMMVGYAIELSENGATVYQRANGNIDQDWMREVRIPLYGSVWQLRVTPAQDTVEAARSHLPTVALFAGFLLTLVLVWVHRLGYQTKLRARDLAEEVLRRQQAEITLHRLNEELEQRVATRTGELRTANTALANEKERWAVTLHSIADGVITTDIDGRVASLNTVAEELTGWQVADAVGQLASEVFHIVDARTGERAVDPITQALGTGKPVAVALPRRAVLRQRDGRERLVTDSAAPIRDHAGNVLGVVLVFQDITDTQKMEDELFKAKNLESIGLLAGGIAHDFNNILTAILGNIGLAKLYAQPGDPVHESLSQAEKGFARARDLTMQLLTFSRGGAPVRTTASVEELLRETSTFALRGSNVRHELHIAPDLWSASIDPGQISQAINNLLLNSKQAMPNGGVITISAENVTMVERGAMRPGPYIKITISDQGSGIAPEHLSRIFDPYFTTKAGGTGLGLATTYSIIKRHQGHIEAESAVGVGTTFRLYLPAAPAAAHAENTRGDEGAAIHGEGRVLVMDDEAPIRDITARSLGILGYEVSVAASGEEAIESYRRALAENRRYDAVILDLTVPGGMGGEECVQHLRSIDPHVHAIVSSGYSNDPIIADFGHHGFDAMVAKPYDMRALAAAVQKATSQSRETEGLA